VKLGGTGPGATHDATLDVDPVSGDEVEKIVAPFQARLRDDREDVGDS
jgi:hypothetical protein